KIFGESPAATGEASSREPGFNESNRKDLTVSDVRFTTKGNKLYAFVMGWADYDVAVRPLAQNSELRVGKIENVELLGFEGKLHWSQSADGLRIKLPQQKPCEYAVVFRITGA
ncbi:MAG: hypothetical protein JO211_12350, partial [Acidobacteriaceae bacterium]|nr:hypothetical protein [Acidobacteriaceae bacterium]